jgi:hypothetical protein
VLCRGRRRGRTRVVGRADLPRDGGADDVPGTGDGGAEVLHGAGWLVRQFPAVAAANVGGTGEVAVGNLDGLECPGHNGVVGEVLAHHLPRRPSPNLLHCLRRRALLLCLASTPVLRASVNVCQKA